MKKIKTREKISKLVKKIKTRENTKANGFRRIRKAKEKLVKTLLHNTKLWIVQKNLLGQGKTRKNTSSLIF